MRYRREDNRSTSTNMNASSSITSNRRYNPSSWENETPITSRGRDALDNIARNSANLTSVRAFPGGGGTGRRETDTATTPMIHRNTQTGTGIGTQRNSVQRNANYNNNNDDEEDDFDRKFYLADDEEFIQDGDNGGQTMGRFLYESAKTKQREEEMERKRTQGINGGMIVNPANSLRNARKNALKDDQEAWENSRLLSSGAAVRGDVDLDFANNEEDTRVTLLVHQVKPPFLGKGASAFSRIRHAVPTIKDNTSDFAKMSREGSDTLRRLREKKEKNAMRQKFWGKFTVRCGGVCIKG